MENARPQQLRETGPGGMLPQTRSPLMARTGKSWPSFAHKRCNRTRERWQHLIIKGERGRRQPCPVELRQWQNQAPFIGRWYRVIHRGQGNEQRYAPTRQRLAHIGLPRIIRRQE
ncbi:hypothetical protein D3C80_1252320 [compost metagenome]